MRNEKVIKDPIYGYITVPSDISAAVIDSPYFQRLRRIAQTSYASLYPSALHNRFVHSLGVYHLGKIASTALSESIKSNKALGTVSLDIDQYSDVFRLACLLHDIGHSPFSHIGEVFFLNVSSNYSGLHNTLSGLVGSSSFTEDLNEIFSFKSAKPHEVMSAIIGLRCFSDILPLTPDSSMKEFFSRCITGYRYRGSSVEDSIKNSFISLLNSEVIDVDRLDYLIRDSFVSGYDSVVIDYDRLLTSVTLISTGSSFEVGFTKNAISIIENVVYAHDYERKWIQNHPIIQYDNYLLSKMIRVLLQSIKVFKDDQKSVETTLFSEEALTNVGVYCQMPESEYLIPIRLLSDDDIVFFIKNVFKGQYPDEYFNRSSRRHPLWKSESEYRSIFYAAVQKGRVLERFSEAMDVISKRFAKDSNGGIINSEYIDKLKTDLESIRNTETGYDELTINTQTEAIDIIICLYEAIQIAQKNNCKIDVVLIGASQFSSGFNKPDFKRIKIEFNINDTKVIRPFSEVASSISGVTPVDYKMFYLYFKREGKVEPSIDLVRLTKQLLSKYWDLSQT